jgi:hypothetical protein
MQHDDLEYPQPDETPDDKGLNQLIDEWLSEERPERYDAETKDWMDPVVEQVATELSRRPREDVVRDNAQRRVYQREGIATKTANRILRDIADSGQLPLEFEEDPLGRLRLPLSIDRQRVRFGAASAEDLKEWELENSREQDKRDQAQIESREGSRLLRGWMQEQGVHRVEDLRP